jgi:hypothetical protein
VHISTKEIEQNLITHQIEKNEDITNLIYSPTTQLKSKQFSVTSSSIYSIHVENQNPITSHTARFRQKKQPISPSISVQINKNRYFYNEFLSFYLPFVTVHRIYQTVQTCGIHLQIQTVQNLSYILSFILFILDNIEQEENDESQYNFYPPTLINDSIETIIEEHKQTVGFYRIQPNRHVLIPHKITIDHSFSDQSHITINQHLSQSSINSFKSPLYSTTSMSLLDLNHNQHYLHEIESVQLLSSLVIRALQIHRQHARSIPGAFSADFTNILNVSQMQFNSSSIVHQRPTSRQYAHIQSNVQAKAIKEGIDFLEDIRKEN